MWREERKLSELERVDNSRNSVACTVEISIFHLTLLFFERFTTLISEFFIWPFAELISFSSKSCFRFKWCTLFVGLLQDSIKFVFINTLELEVWGRNLGLGNLCRLFFFDIWMRTGAAADWISSLSLIWSPILLSLLFIVLIAVTFRFTGCLFCLSLLSHYLLSRFFLLFWLRRRRWVLFIFLRGLWWWLLWGLLLLSWLLSSLLCIARSSEMCLKLF